VPSRGEPERHQPSTNGSFLRLCRNLVRSSKYNINIYNIIMIYKFKSLWRNCEAVGRKGREGELPSFDRCLFVVCDFVLAICILFLYIINIIIINNMLLYIWRAERGKGRPL